MNKITIEFDNITKPELNQSFYMHLNLDTNLLSIAAALNKMVEDLNNQTGSVLFDAMIFLCDQEKKELSKHYEKEDDLLFGDCDNGD